MLFSDAEVLAESEALFSADALELALVEADVLALLESVPEPLIEADSL
ncbi:hypothetical protein [Fructilactobacillus frigidiflavus]